MSKYVLKLGYVTAISFDIPEGVITESSMTFNVQYKRNSACNHNSVAETSEKPEGVVKAQKDHAVVTRGEETKSPVCQNVVKGASVNI